MSSSSEFSNQKPSFSQKCSMLSQYLKEKGSFGDLSIGMSCKIEPSIETRETAATTMDLFPQQSGFMTHDSRVNKSAYSEPQSAAPMTIFYGGRVIVFDNLGADQAKEVMLLASQGSSRARTASPPKMPNVLPNVQRPPQAVACDLPIARRASLHRFLEKRKDRVTAKPYQASSPVASPSPRPVAESKSWLGLAGQSPQPFHC